MNLCTYKAVKHIPDRHRYNVCTTSRIASIKKNYHQQKRINTGRVKSLNTDVVTLSHFVGKSIVAFTFFYTSLNYMYYKRLREEHEEDTKDENDKK